MNGNTTYYVWVTGEGSITVYGGIFTESANDKLLGGFNGMPSWDASEALKSNGYSIFGGTFIANGESVELK